MNRPLAVLVLVTGCDGVWHLQHVDPPRDGAGSGEADAADTPNVAFVTSMPIVPGALGGTAGADAMCESLAHAAGLAGHYVAWLSTATDDARSRLEVTSPRGWVRRDGKPFADTVNDIVHGNVWYPLRLTEAGDDVAAAGSDADVVVATGTKVDGTLAVGTNCLDFTQQGAATLTGLADAGALRWTAAISASCAQPARLYCFGTDHDVPVTVSPESTRLAFVTNGDYGPAGGGRNAFDTACHDEAIAAGVPGTFHAAVATSTQAALARFAAGTPWVRKDGVTVIASDGTLEAPLLIDAFGQAEPGNIVWGGAASLTARAASAAQACGDWTSFSGSAVAVADNTRSGVWGFGHDSGVCNVADRLYCLQD